MSSSILKDVKKLLSLADDNTAFDTDVLIHINSNLANLNQLGIGVAAGFAVVDDSATWADFLGTEEEDPRLSQIKTYVFLRTKIVFDPPTGSYHLVNSMNEQIKELEWRLNVQREETDYVAPVSLSALGEIVEIIVPVNDAWVGG